MKHYLSLLVALALLVPTAALAQAGGEGAEAPPDPTASDGADDDDEEEEEDYGEPEVSVPPSEAAGVSVSGELTTPSVSHDVAEAEEERVRTAAAGEEDEDLVDEQLEEERLPWRNSMFLWDNEVSTTTFDGGSSTLSYNPSYTMAFSFRPRWYLTEDISVRLRQDMVLEMTDTDTRVRNREPVLADTLIDLVHGNVYELEGATLSAGARLSLPLSISSRAYQKYFGIGPNVAISRPFEDVMEGLQLGLTSSYSYNFAGSNVPLAEDDDVPQTRAPQIPRQPGEPVDAGSVPPQSSGLSTVDHAWTLGLSASLSPVENLTVETSFTWWWTHGRGLADACSDVLTGAVCLADNSKTHTRLATWLTFGVGYQFIDWLNASLNYSHLTGEFNYSASRRNPLWSPDSAVSLTASITLDKLYGALSGRSSSPTEVVEGTDEQGSATAAAPTVGGTW